VRSTRAKDVTRLREFESTRQLEQAIGAVSPLALFASSEPGYWLDPSDFSTMWQDSAGTTPVTAVNDPVGRITDKSGNGVVFTQATSANRPLLKQDSNGYYYLDFDGSNDYLGATANVNLSSTNKVSLFIAWRTKGYTGNQTTFLGGGYGTAGGISLFSEGGSSGEPPSLAATGSSNGYVYFCAQGVGNLLLAANVDISQSAFADEVQIRLNRGAVPCQYNAGPLGTGNFGSFQHKIGANHLAGGIAGGRLYGVILRGALTTGQAQKDTENWLNSKCGFLSS
jgi:hypothetical protein